MTDKTYIGKNFVVDLTDIVLIAVNNGSYHSTIKLTNSAGVSFYTPCLNQHSAELVFDDITTKWKAIKNEN